MNRFIRRAIARSITLALLALCVHLPAQAGQSCDLSNNDPSTEDQGGSTADGNDAMACGFNNTADGDNSTAVGRSNDATDNFGVAMGFGNIASGSFGVAIGMNNNAGQNGVAIGFANVASGGFGTALGQNNVASGLESSAVGFDSRAEGFGSSAFGHGSRAFHLSTAIGFSSSAIGDASIALGGWFDSNGDFVADPEELTLAAGTYAIAVGPAAWATGEMAIAFGNTARALADGSVALGNGSVANRAETISVGSFGAERQIVNVAAGTELTDAVNLSQLQDTLNTSKAYTDTAVATGGTEANAYTDDREEAIRKDMTGGDTQTLEAANAYTDQKFAGFDFSGIDDRFDAIEQRLGRQDARIDRNGAMSAAMMNMGTNIAGTSSGRGKLAVGAGFQGGRQALSVGYGKRIGQRTSFSLSGAFSGSEKSAGIGFGVEL